MRKSNNKAQLTYPVGLLSFPEAYILNNNNIRKTGQSYWLLSPVCFGFSGGVERSITSSGERSYTLVNNTTGVRPVISLKPDTEIVSGTGSIADPYIVQ